MSMRKIIHTVLFTCLVLPLYADELGRKISEEDIRAWDISIGPDGVGLPQGTGTAVAGERIYQQQCATCHGASGIEGPADVLVGGLSSLTTDAPVKTVGSYWPYATTVFDYVRRSMPFFAPGSLSDDDSYAVTAYLLFLNNIVEEDAVLDASTLPKVEMPNRLGFVSWYPNPPE